MRFPLQTASLRQLVILSFLLAMIPVGVLMWQSHKALSGLSRFATSEAERAVISVRRAENMQNLVVDIERAVRQYAVVKTDALARVAQSHITNQQASLSELCNDLPELSDCLQQQTDLQQLAAQFTELSGSPLEQQLQQIRLRQQRISQQIWDLLEQRLQNQQQLVCTCHTIDT